MDVSFSFFDQRVVVVEIPQDYDLNYLNNEGSRHFGADAESA